VSAPAGWYPDPADAAARRWWDGTQWTAQTAPAPRFGEYAPNPAAPVAPVAPAAPAYPPYPTAPASADPGATPPAVDVPTQTIWVWLAVAASVLPMLSIFLFDWNGYLSLIAAMMRAAESGSGTAAATADLTSWEMRTLGISLIGWACYAAFIVFSWLDWRELKRRGVPAPFGWAWSFFVLVSAGSAVYMIGRAVVLRRRTVAGGWAPLWTWVAATVVGFVAAISLGVWLVGEILQIVSVGTLGS